MYRDAISGTSMTRLRSEPPMPSLSATGAGSPSLVMAPTVSNTAGGLRPYAEERLGSPGHARIGRWPAVEPPATNWCCTSGVHEGSCTSLRNWPDR